MNVWLLVLLFSMPWRPECTASVLRMGIVYHQAPCYVGGQIASGWVGADNRIHLCALPDVRKDRLLLHESQHLLARLYLNPQCADDWARFGGQAMEALRAGDYTADERIFAENMLHSGGQELHAELPLIVGGNIPMELQLWYPWFDLSQASSVKAKHAG